MEVYSKLKNILVNRGRIEENILVKYRKMYSRI